MIMMMMMMMMMMIVIVMMMMMMMVMMMMMKHLLSEHAIDRSMVLSLGQATSSRWTSSVALAFSCVAWACAGCLRVCRFVDL